MGISFQDITIRYGQHSVLDGFSLDVLDGAITTLLGRNGCGKSSLLNLLVEIVKPAAGLVELGGRPLTSLSRQERARMLGYLPQSAHLPKTMTVRELVANGRYPHRQSSTPEEDEHHLIQALSDTDLLSLQSRPLGSLSGGERQRARLALILCQSPQILALDEPTTYLDLAYQLEILDLVQQLKEKRQLTVLMVLHDLNLAARYSDRICLVAEGKNLQTGPVEDVLVPEQIKRALGVEVSRQWDAESGRPYFLAKRAYKNTLQQAQAR